VRFPRSFAVLATAAALALVAGGCAEEVDPAAMGGATDTATRGTTPGTGAPGTTAPDPIEWDDCGNAECARVTVPLEHDDPGGEQVELLVARAPARGDRRGALFFNPGGPGGAAAELTATLALVLPREITEHFDIVGMDPRGVGGSVSLGCEVELEDLLDSEFDPTTDEEREEVVEASREFADECDEGAGDLLAHVGTGAVARDMDLVRTAMGDEQISFLGLSYGSVIGQVYADLFPDRVRAMVLDGIVELGPSGLDQSEQQLAGFGVALERFASRCVADDGCPAGPDPLALLDEVLAAAEDGGIPAADAGRPAGPADVVYATAYAMYAEELWSSLERALDEAASGDGSRLIRLTEEYFDSADFAVYYAVLCLDFAWPEDPEEAFEASEDWEGPSVFGEGFAGDAVQCSQWPVPADPLEPVTAPGAPPILVVSTTGDPATPYEAGVRVAERLVSGVLLTVEGEGHTATLGAGPCVTAIVTRYLVDLEPPEDGARCP
jgi:pimeloyl-ACP methyl ester carboxylesterase